MISIRPLMLVAAITLASLAAPAHAQPLLRIHDYPGVGNFLARIAEKRGLCARHGVRCELRTIPQAPLALQTLLAGDIEVYFGPPEVMLQAVNKGAALRVIGSGARTPPFFLMAAKDLPTPNAARGYPALMHDFKGKKIGVTARGTGSEFQLVSLLAGAGLTRADVTLVAVGSPNTAYPAIQRGQVDALMLFSPMDGFCEVTQACRIVLDPRRGQGPDDIVKLRGAANVQAVRADFLSANAAAVAAYQKAMHEAAAFARDPANFETMLALARETSFNIAVPGGAQILEVALRNAARSWTEFSADPQALQHAADYLHRSGQINRVVDTASLLAQ